MIKSLLRNFSLRKKAGSKSSERISAFLTLMRLDFKAAFLDKQNRECSERIFNYKVWGYSYFLLDYLFKEVFLSQEYFFETDTTEPVIIDCGSNIGMSVLYFKKLFPRSRVIAFEANPHAYRLLEKNVSVNHLTNVELHNVVLSDREGEISFFVPEDMGSLLASTKSERGGETEITCRAQKLSDAIRIIDKIDLIKIDVEGSELTIVNDLVAANLLNRADQYVIEYHHNMDDLSSFSNFLKIFESHGFGYNIKAAFQQIRSFQDLLIHFYKKK